MGRLAAAFVSIGCAVSPVMATAITGSKAPGAARATTSIASGDASMTVTVVPRSESRAFGDTTLVYLDGRIDPDTPDRIAAALDGVNGKISIWLNSPGGNLFAGMQLGRVLRQHGGSTHIINHRTLLPGECYSACSLAFLGGVFRFNDNGARYGVHRASLQGGPPARNRDLGPDLSMAIKSYIREIGVDARLFDLWTKAGPDEMYVLSPPKAESLGVVNNGRQPPDWSIAAFPGGTMLQGRQTTVDGTGTLSFSCDNSRTVLGSVYEPAVGSEAGADRPWSHWLTIDNRREIPLRAVAVSSKDGVVRSTFTLPSNLLRLAMSAKQIGHRMTSSSDRSPSIGYRVDIDAGSRSTVRKFLGNCLRGQAQ